LILDLLRPHAKKVFDNNQIWYMGRIFTC